MYLFRILTCTRRRIASLIAAAFKVLSDQDIVCSLTLHKTFLRFLFDKLFYLSAIRGESYFKDVLYHVRK